VVRTLTGRLALHVMAPPPIEKAQLGGVNGLRPLLLRSWVLQVGLSKSVFGKLEIDFGTITDAHDLSVAPIGTLDSKHTGGVRNECNER
jgi:hypothetical protein